MTHDVEDSRNAFHLTLDRAAELDAAAKQEDADYIAKQRANPPIPVFRGPDGFQRALEASAQLHEADAEEARQYHQRVRERFEAEDTQP